MAAPLIKPGKSQIVYLEFKLSSTPRFGEIVVKGYESVFAFEFVIFLIKVLFPELGRPKIAISVIKLKSSLTSFLNLLCPCSAIPGFGFLLDFRSLLPAPPLPPSRRSNSSFS